jgi:hypothetical protein
LGFTGVALVVVVVRVGVVLLVVGAVVVVLVVGAVVGLFVGVVPEAVAARGVCAAPVHALSARQAAANQTVCRMVTEGSPAPPPPALRPAGFEANTPSRTDESVSNRR